MKSIIIATAIFGLGAVAQAEDFCTMPEKPVIDLDAENASKRDVYQVYNQVRAYQRSLDEYRDCLDAHDYVPTTKRELYNASIDLEEVLVADFNKILNAVRAKESNA